MGAQTNDHYVEKVIDYIMRKCLWQFHSRAWDRERQNAGIMTQTTQILCGEQPDVQTPENRCYWVDAVMMARGLIGENPELADMNNDDIRLFMTDAKKRLDFLTIHGSLNQELTDPKY
ncbi:Fe-only nitrogenase subunit delta [Desulfovibrio sp. 86]|uniref:Nitrogenase iron-iron protein delta chain n=1 Tax=uncultured Desulfovibrio sp. TaxID=167968 RepID=A0A212L1W9_9BACT|nr:Fe-only nitrogenase subunit delta [Desulfovibrio sp. 86]SCM71518.1 Nitrogenase iron-iron protein delta chain [uncultured Desulfovibrio sp.]VZH32923.1 Nitrogenase iron-iron protein delta chain [Desulfovibrio sp. 86]